MSRKITQRLFILMTVLIVTLSSLSSSLTVFADQYTGSSGGGLVADDGSEIVWGGDLSGNDYSGGFGVDLQ